MDPERQPLINYPNSDVRTRFRPLTRDEVSDACQEVRWKRAKFLLVLMFWAIMAMFLSVIACIVVTAPKCNQPVGYSSLPSVPPVHRSIIPLMSIGRTVSDDNVNYMT